MYPEYGQSIDILNSPQSPDLCPLSSCIEHVLEQQAMETVDQAVATKMGTYHG